MNQVHKIPAISESYLGGGASWNHTVFGNQSKRIFIIHDEKANVGCPEILSETVLCCSLHDVVNLIQALRKKLLNRLLLIVSQEILRFRQSSQSPVMFYIVV